MEELIVALRDLNEKRVYELVEEKIKNGVPAMEIVRLCNEGMVAIGDLFSQGVYFISELLFSAEILKGVMKRLDPLLQAAGANLALVMRTLYGLGTPRGWAERTQEALRAFWGSIRALWHRCERHSFGT